MKNRLYISIIMLLTLCSSLAMSKQFLRKPITKQEQKDLFKLIKAPRVGLTVSVSIATKESFISNEKKEVNIKSMLSKLNNSDKDGPLLIKIASAYADKNKKKKALSYYKKAAAIFNKTLEKNKHNEKALYNLATIMEAIGNIPAAFSLYLKALSINKHNAEIWQNLGYIFISHKNDRKRAFYCFSNALKLNPNNPELYAALQIMMYSRLFSLPKQVVANLIKTNKLEEKINFRLIKKAISVAKKEKNKYEILYRFLQLHRIFLKLMFKDNINFPFTENNMNSFSEKDLSILRKVEKLIFSDQATKKMKPSPLYKLRGLLFLVKGNKKKSLHWFEKALIADEADQVNYKNLALFYAHLLPDKKKFHTLMKKKREMAPEPDDHLILGRFFFKNEKFAAANVEYKKAILKMPKNSNSYLGMAASLVRIGKTEAAKKLVKKAITIDSNNHVAVLWSGIFLLTENKGEKAFSRFVTVLRLSKDDKQCIKILDEYFKEDLRFKAQSLAKKNQ